MQVQSPSWEDLMQEGMATHSGFLPGESTSWTEEESAGCSLWSCQESDTSVVPEQAHTDILLRKLSSSHFTFLPTNY